MKLALECPTNMIEQVQPLGDFDFILLHKVLTDADYANYYKTSNRVKYLDNSVNEVGEPAPLEDLEKGAEMLGGVDYILSPDWIGDSSKTIEAYKACASRFTLSKVIPVIQGSSFKEAFDCLEFYLRVYAGNPNVPLPPIAAPYRLTCSKEDSPKLMGTSRALVVSSIPPAVRVHLLGFSFLDELSFYNGKPNIESIDTGLPVMLALKNKDILDPIESKEKSTFSQMESEELDSSKWASICRNIAVFRKYL